MDVAHSFFFFSNIIFKFLNIYLSVPGLSCNTQDL